jgi:hypothetical protein
VADIFTCSPKLPRLSTSLSTDDFRHALKIDDT